MMCMDGNMAGLLFVEFAIVGMGAGVLGAVAIRWLEKKGLI